MSHLPHIPIPHVDKLLLIKLVSERPALWDTTAESYKCKFLKRAAWQEVAVILKNDYSKLSATEKQKFYTAVIKIWRHIRDTWRRSLNARANGRKSGVVVRPYKYHREMLFLKKLPKVPARRIAETSDTEEEEEETEVIEESESDSINVSENVYENECENDSNVDSKEGINVSVIDEEINTTNEHRTVKKQDFIFVPEEVIDTKMIAYMDKRIQQMRNPCETQQEDRHFAFFKSVHPTLTLLNDDQILEFQSGVINLLRNIKSGGRFNSFTNDQPSSSGYYSQAEVQNISQQAGVGPRVVQISSSTAESRTQPKMSLDPLI